MWVVWRSCVFPCKPCMCLLSLLWFLSFLPHITHHHSKGACKFTFPKYKHTRLLFSFYGVLCWTLEECVKLMRPAIIIFFLNQTNKSLDHVQCSVCRPFLSTAEEVPCHVINGIVLAVTKARTWRGTQWLIMAASWTGWSLTFIISQW